MSTVHSNLLSIRKILLLVLCLVAIQPLMSKGRYDLRFGLMMPTAGGFIVVSTETYSIEKIVNSNYLHGFTVQKKGGGRFMVSYSVRFPEPLDIGDNVSTKGTFSEGGRVYTTDGVFVWDRHFEVYSFEESDPLGTYELSVFIDGKLYQKIKYDVSKPLSDIEFDEDLGF